jgi:hypothetical protein
MARHIWTVVCRKAVIDAANTVTLFDALEELGVFPEPPAQMLGKGVLPVEMAVVTLWMRDDVAIGEAPTQRMRILAPDGRQLAVAEQAFDLERYQRARNIANLPGLLYAGLGTYTVEVSRKTDGKYEVVASVPFDLKVGPDPTKRN